MATRQEMIALWNAVLDDGFSASLMAAVRPELTPAESYHVEVHALGFTMDQLLALNTVAEAHDAELKIDGFNGMQVQLWKS